MTDFIRWDIYRLHPLRCWKTSSVEICCRFIRWFVLHLDKITRHRIFTISPPILPIHWHFIERQNINSNRLKLIKAPIQVSYKCYVIINLLIPNNLPQFITGEDSDINSYLMITKHKQNKVQRFNTKDRKFYRWFCSSSLSWLLGPRRFSP